MYVLPVHRIVYVAPGKIVTGLVIAVVPVSVGVRLDEAVFTKVQKTPAFEAARVGTVRPVRAATRYVFPLIPAVTVRLVDAEISVMDSTYWSGAVTRTACVVADVERTRLLLASLVRRPMLVKIVLPVGAAPECG